MTILIVGCGLSGAVITEHQTNIIVGKLSSVYEIQNLF